MKDDQTPATKADIRSLMDSLGKLYDANERWKEEVKTDVKQHFDVVVENMHHDLLGVNHDQIQVLSDRTNLHETGIRRLETHTGVI